MVGAGTSIIGGSDPHDVLSIACNYTRVPDAASAAGFLDGIARGLAEAVQRPSSPRNVAHNLYSTTSSTAKLDLGQQVPHDFLLRYDYSPTGEEMGAAIAIGGPAPAQNQGAGLLVDLPTESFPANHPSAAPEVSHFYV